MKLPAQMAPGALLGLLLILMGSCVSASNAAATDGAALYLSNCANCHGVYGEGDGPVSPDLSVALLDLRYLSQRNGGVYPIGFVTDIVDGRVTRSSHGPAGMPVWGAEFARGEGSDAAIAARIQDKTDALNAFLRSIQISE